LTLACDGAGQVPGSTACCSLPVLNGISAQLES
jgi:hypothetical protein